MRTYFSILLIYFLLVAQSCSESKSNQGTKQVTVTIGFEIEDFLKHYLLSLRTSKYLTTMQNYRSETSSFSIAKFVKAFEKSYPNESIVKLFNLQKSPGLFMNFSNEEVREYLENECKTTFLAIENQLQQRIAMMTSATPTFKHYVSKGQIAVQIKNIKNVNRVTQTLQASVQLEFYEVYSLNEITGNLDFAFNVCDELHMDKADSTTNLINIPSIRSMINPNGYAVGLVAPRNQQKVMELLTLPDVKELLPEDLEFMWAAFPEESGKYKGMFCLYPIKIGEYDRISSGDIVEAKPGLTQDNSFMVSLTMTEDAAGRWQKMTGKNIGRQIAMTIDQKVYSAPVVNGEITMGITEISGGFDAPKAKELASIINAGTYKIPFQIISVK